MNRFESKSSVSLLLILLALSTILDGLDASIVNVALPTISQELNVSIGDTSWITLTYVVALASLLLPMAKLAKNGTVKRIFIGGIIIFTIASALCGITNEFFGLVFFRLIQGVGAALMTAAVPVLIADFLPADRKGLGMGVLAVASGISVVVGPSVGGIITSMVSWHWIFLINIPFGIIAVALSLKILPKDEGYEKSKNPDFVNSILTVFGIAAVMMCIQNITGSSMSQMLIAGCGIIGAAFLSVMGYRMSKKPDVALISPEMLKRSDFLILSVAFTMTTMVIMGTHYVLPYFLQIYGEYSVSESGLLLSVASVFAIALSVPVGKWCDVRGCKLPSVLAGVGRLIFCVIFIIAVPKEDFALLLFGLAVMGCSMAFAGTGLATAMIHHADEKYQADAATFLMEVNYVAASLGVVLYSIIFQAGIGTGTVADVVKSAVESSFDMTMIAGCVLSVIAIVCALYVKNIIPEKN